MTKINMDGVNQNSGVVDPKKFDILRNWNKKYRLQHVCCRLRDAMVCEGVNVVDVVYEMQWYMGLR